MNAQSEIVITEEMKQKVFIVYHGAKPYSGCDYTEEGREVGFSVKPAANSEKGTVIELSLKRARQCIKENNEGGTGGWEFFKEEKKEEPEKVKEESKPEDKKMKKEKDFKKDVTKKPVKPGSMKFKRGRKKK